MILSDPQKAIPFCSSNQRPPVRITVTLTCIARRIVFIAASRLTPQLFKSNRILLDVLEPSQTVLQTLEKATATTRTPGSAHMMMQASQALVIGQDPSQLIYGNSLNIKCIAISP